MSYLKKKSDWQSMAHTSSQLPLFIKPVVESALAFDVTAHTLPPPSQGGRLSLSCTVALRGHGPLISFTSKPLRHTPFQGLKEQPLLVAPQTA